MHLFGTTRVTAIFGKENTIKNLWKKNIKVKNKLHSDKITTKAWDHPGVPEGTTATLRWEFVDGDRDRILWYQRCSRPDKDHEVEFTQYFVRDGTQRKSKK